MSDRNVWLTPSDFIILSKQTHLSLRAGDWTHAAVNFVALVVFRVFVSFRVSGCVGVCLGQICDARLNWRGAKETWTQKGARKMRLSAFFVQKIQKVWSGRMCGRRDKTGEGSWRERRAQVSSYLEYFNFVLFCQQGWSSKNSSLSLSLWICVASNAALDTSSLYYSLGVLERGK